MQNEPCLNNFIRESEKNAKNPQNRNLERNFKHMTMVFDSN